MYFEQILSKKYSLVSPTQETHVFYFVKESITGSCNDVGLVGGVGVES